MIECRPRRRVRPRCGATATCTRPGATAGPPSRRWRHGDRARPRVPGPDRPLAPPDGRARPRPERLQAQLEELGGAQRAAGAVPDPHRHGGRHPRGRPARPRRRPARPARRRRGERPLEAADGAPADDRSAWCCAAASPHVDILGHCTGRLIGKRPESAFDADYVFAACAQFDTAVEINCRPERLDPPKELLDLALSLRLLRLDRLRRPRHGPARVAAPRLREGRGQRGARRAGDQHLGGRRPADLDGDLRWRPDPRRVGPGHGPRTTV